jgi:fused signal recognition particle receptor
MFGFLKQKIADFGNKLKQTVAKEEEKRPQEEKSGEIKKEEEKREEKKTDSKKEIHKKKETPSEKPIQAQKTETKKVEETPLPKKETIPIEKKEIKAEEKKEETIKKEEEKDINQKKEQKPKEEKKTGFLGKIFGFGKKDERGEKKKTREEIAEELEKKMFAEIEEEVKREEKDKGKQEDELAKMGREDLHAEKIKEDTKEEKEIEKKRQEAPGLEKAIRVEEKLQTKEVTEEIEEEIEEELEDLQKQEEKITGQGEIAKEKKHEEKGEKITEKPRDIYVKTLEEDKRELKAKVGVAGGIKGFLFGGIEITEKQIEELLWELELSLIESDVEAEAAKELVTQIKKKLVGNKVSAKNIDEYLKEQIKEILAEMMHTEKINLLEETKEHKPLKILMLGPNGAGKTTSIAKLVHYFQKHKKSCIVAAADTFRAGAIDQLEEHAKRLSVRVIKQQYGADPAAVAFDAIKAAEAGKIDIVIIDSAGRQETNKNLMEELRKIERVAKPDLKIYVGESYVGQTLLEQVQEFEEITGIDGFILTKIDTDAKGGTAISLLYKMKKPIIFVGTGQGYDDFKEFTPEFILERII